MLSFFQFSGFFSWVFVHYHLTKLCQQNDDQLVKWRKMVSIQDLIWLDLCFSDSPKKSHIWPKVTFVCRLSLCPSVKTLHIFSLSSLFKVKRNIADFFIAFSDVSHRFALLVISFNKHKLLSEKSVLDSVESWFLSILLSHSRHIHHAQYTK